MEECRIDLSSNRIALAGGEWRTDSSGGRGGRGGKEQGNHEEAAALAQVTSVGGGRGCAGKGSKC